MTAAIIEPPLTRRDVEEIVGRVVGEVVSEALMLI